MSTEIRTILVEDSDRLRSFLREFVERVDRCHIVAEAVGGLDAFNVIKTVPADLIMLDLDINDPIGFSVLQEARQISPAKILVTTMDMSEDKVQQTLDAGADGIFVKGRGAKLLESTILEVLDGKRPVYV